MGPSHVKHSIWARSHLRLKNRWKQLSVQYLMTIWWLSALLLCSVTHFCCMEVLFFIKHLFIYSTKLSLCSLSVCAGSVEASTWRIAWFQNQNFLKWKHHCLWDQLGNKFSLWKCYYAYACVCFHCMSQFCYSYTRGPICVFSCSFLCLIVMFVCPAVWELLYLPSFWLWEGVNSDGS